MESYECHKLNNQESGNANEGKKLNYLQGARSQHHISRRVNTPIFLPRIRHKHEPKQSNPTLKNYNNFSNEHSDSKVTTS